MADYNLTQTQNLPPEMRTRYVDMGDGTHAKRLYVAEVDSVTNSLRIISNAHAEVHEGETFRAWLVNTAVNNNAYLDIGFTTTTKTAHIVFGSSAGGAAIFSLYKNANISSGSAFTPHNLNDVSSETSTVTVVTGPTVNSAGTLIDQEYLPGGTGPLASGGSIRSDTEDIWATSTVYLVRLQNVAGSSKGMSLELQWYEED